jgi:hypothetical protein
MSDLDQSGGDPSEHSRDDDDEASGPPRGALVALLLVAVLIVGFMFVMYRLHQADQLQDCVASGRTNCAPIDTQHQ